MSAEGKDSLCSSIPTHLGAFRDSRAGADDIISEHRVSPFHLNLNSVDRDLGGSGSLLSNPFLLEYEIFPVQFLCHGGSQVLGPASGQ